MIKRLDETGYRNYEKYWDIRLTDNGFKLLRVYAIDTRFWLNSLDDAEGIELHLHQEQEIQGIYDRNKG
jgi:Mn-dependent DtxR family transcriptional regulator